MSWDTYRRLDEARERERRKIRFRDYDETTQVLIISIPTGPHEQSHRGIYNLFFKQVVAMGLDGEWIDIGTETFYKDGAPPGGRRGKESDSAGGPDPQRLGAGQWPTLVVEAGFTESMSQLRNDMYKWFSDSGHQVKIVVLTKFDNPAQTITVEKWVEVEAEGRPGTRSRPRIAPQLDQTISITRTTGSVQNLNISVTSSPLILEFELLFLRPPVLAQGERDFSFGNADLLRYAARVYSRL